MQVERAAQQVERVVDRLVDLLDARARESLAPHLLLRGRLARAEQAVAARVLLDAHELRLDARAGGHPDARDLRPEEQQVEQREGADEARLRREGRRGWPRRAS